MPASTTNKAYLFLIGESSRIDKKFYQIPKIQFLGFLFCRRSEDIFRLGGDTDLGTQDIHPREEKYDHTGKPE